MTTDPKAERHFRITNNNAIDLHVGNGFVSVERFLA